MKRTTRKNSIIVCALLGVMVAGQAMAADIRYKASGDWFDFLAAGNVGPNGWQNVAGVPGLPGAADTARFNWGNNTVTLAGAAPTIAAFQMGVDESGGLVVNNGGSLTATGNSKIGNNAGGGGVNPTSGFLTVNSGGVVNAQGGWLMVAGNSGALTGVVTLNGGNLNVSGHLWVSTGAGSLGTIDIFGGTLSVGGMLGLGTVNATSPSGGTGLLNVNNGGILALSNIDAGTNPDTTPRLGSIQPGSLLDISGSGLVTIPGNFTAVMNTYITAGRITGNDVVGNVQAIFDADLNKTFLTVIPEPSTFALMALMGVGLMVRRLGRKSWN
jgi:hypothetical protein